jgi:hypothetical protein
MDDDDGFSTTPAPRQNPILTLARDHIALLIPIAGALIFALRCVIVSEGDPYVASMLVSTTSIGDATRALLFTVMPLLLLVSAFAVAFASVTRIAHAGRRDYKNLSVGIAGAGVSIALSIGWLYTGGIFILLGGTFTFDRMFFIALFGFAPLLFVTSIVGQLRGRRIRGRGPDRRGLDSGLGIAVFPAGVMALIIVVFLGLTVGSKNFWLPRERLVFKDEEYYGYVLKESGGHLVILNDKPRVVVEKDKGSLEDRDFCYSLDHRARDFESMSLEFDMATCPP